MRSLIMPLTNTNWLPPCAMRTESGSPARERREWSGATWGEEKMRARTMDAFWHMFSTRVRTHARTKSPSFPRPVYRRCLAWATEPGNPVLATGSADGRVRVWRPMGEGKIKIDVSGAQLKHIRPGKELVYAVVSVGRNILMGEEAVLDVSVDFPKVVNNTFEVLNTRQVIGVYAASGVCSCEESCCKDVTGP